MPLHASIHCRSTTLLSALVHLIRGTDCSMLSLVLSYITYADMHSSYGSVRYKHVSYK